MKDSRSRQCFPSRTTSSKSICQLPVSHQPQSCQSWGGFWRVLGNLWFSDKSTFVGSVGQIWTPVMGFWLLLQEPPIVGGGGWHPIFYIVSLSLLEITGRTCLPGYIYPDSQGEHSMPGSQMQRQYMIRDKARKQQDKIIQSQVCVTSELQTDNSQHKTSTTWNSCKHVYVPRTMCMEFLKHLYS